MEDLKDPGMVDPQIFEHLQAKIDEDAQVRDQIRAILQTLERQGRTVHSILSRAHSTPASQRKPPSRLDQAGLTDKYTVQSVLTAAEVAIKDEVETVGKLSAVASKFPYYKWVATV